MCKLTKLSLVQFVFLINHAVSFPQEEKNFNNSLRDFSKRADDMQLDEELHMPVGNSHPRLKRGVLDALKGKGKKKGTQKFNWFSTIKLAKVDTII